VIGLLNGIHRGAATPAKPLIERDWSGVWFLCLLQFSLVGLNQLFELCDIEVFKIRLAALVHNLLQTLNVFNSLREVIQARIVQRKFF